MLIINQPSMSLTDMSKMTYQRIAGPDMTESVLEEAAALFSDHYGIWGVAARPFTTPGLYNDTSI